MWIERIQNWTTDCRFAAPASRSQIEASERSLGLVIPEDLRSLLLETNGVQGEYDLGLVWPIERIETDNLQFRMNDDFRELYMPFDHLLFFADAGNGDQFAYALNDGIIRRPDVFSWNHEDDSRNWVAPRLETYLEWWLSGRLKL